MQVPTPRVNPVFDRQWLEEYGGMNGLRVSDVVSMLDLNLDEVQPYIYPDAEEIGLSGLGQYS